jgi:hypothetical protein
MWNTEMQIISPVPGFRLTKVLFFNIRRRMSDLAKVGRRINNKIKRHGPRKYVKFKPRLSAVGFILFWEFPTSSTAAYHRHILA